VDNDIEFRKSLEEALSSTFESEVSDLSKGVVSHLLSEFDAKDGDDIAEFAILWLRDRIVAQILYEMREATYNQEESSGDRVAIQKPYDMKYRAWKVANKFLEQAVAAIEKEFKEDAQGFWYSLMLEASMDLLTKMRPRLEGPFVVKNTVINGLRLFGSREELQKHEYIDDIIEEALIPFF